MSTTDTAALAQALKDRPPAEPTAAGSATVTTALSHGRAAPSPEQNVALQTVHIELANLESIKLSEIANLTQAKSKTTQDRPPTQSITADGTTAIATLPQGRAVSDTVKAITPIQAADVELLSINYGDISITLKIKNASTVKNFLHNKELKEFLAANPQSQTKPNADAGCGINVTYNPVEQTLTLASRPSEEESTVTSKAVEAAKPLAEQFITITFRSPILNEAKEQATIGYKKARREFFFSCFIMFVMPILPKNRDMLNTIVSSSKISKINQNRSLEDWGITNNPFLDLIKKGGWDRGKLFLLPYLKPYLQVEQASTTVPSPANKAK